MFFYSGQSIFLSVDPRPSCPSGRPYVPANKNFFSVNQAWTACACVHRLMSRLLYDLVPIPFSWHSADSGKRQRNTILGILNDTGDGNLRSQIDAEVCAIQALSAVSQFIVAQAKCTVRVSKLFFQNCAQPHEDSLYVLPHINLYLSQDRYSLSCLIFKTLAKEIP